MIEKNDRKKTKLTVVLLFIIITIIIIVGIVFALLITDGSETVKSSIAS